MSVGGQAAAFAEALSSNREFNLRTFTDWIRTQQVLGMENPTILKSIEVLSEALYRFLPGFTNLQLKQENNKYVLTINKGDTTLNLNQLSDGERGILALVMEIARRLYQANPGLEDPLTEGRAVILIDELDLHLHPKWQRSIVENLTRVFPNCQFIATTHSPQIIPALDPERIHIINRKEVINPDRSLGMDTNWILKYLMDSDDRPEGSAKAIEEIEQLIDDIEFVQAIERMEYYKKRGLDLPEWSVFEARIARFTIIDEKE
ncbi:MAG: AAA family ATPase [Bacteroides sp.]|nr:AAA family ATPase [Bacteroides sp.]